MVGILTPTLTFFLGADSIGLESSASLRLTHKAVARRAKTVQMLKANAIATLPGFLFLETLGLLVLFNQVSWLWILPIGAVSWIAIRYAYAAAMNCWILGAIPISQTNIADGETRIRSWERCAGVRLERILVVPTGQAGDSNAQVCGLRHPIMIIGETLWNTTDWRQRDAVICHELGHAHRRDLFGYAGLNILATLCLALAWVSSRLDAKYFLASLSLVLANVPFWSSVAWGLLLWLRRGHAQRSEYACDRFSATLTGDPIAMVVALMTINANLGTKIKRRGSQTHPGTQKRIQRLIEILEAGGQLAPWARQRVPAILGAENTLATTLAEAPPPAPVPTVPGQRIAALDPVAALRTKR